ncbi:hypothetical protein [Streptomyces sp. CC224B]|uniref:hypothetical protein n=1 Tax=Streptomyces sp. CC224B TaxID=3044571 RepID=UPI0024A9853C|nr:hypothetical protein [Streptomyces sp. CC224B]
MADLHPAARHVLRYFDTTHLPPPLAEVAGLFEDLAAELARRSLDGPELTVALRKLLEAKDAAVRAALPAKEA